MRSVTALLVIVGLTTIGFLGPLAPASDAVPNRIEFSSLDAVSRWIAGYRARPEPARLPQAVRALSAFGAFKDPESSGVYVGFIAGVIGFSYGKAEEIIGKTLPVPSRNWSR